MLDLAVEDYYGLYELLHEMPDAPAELRAATGRRELLSRVVRELAADGLIEVMVRPRHDVPPRPAVSTDITGLIGDERSWGEPRPTDPVVVIGATQLGEQVHYRHNSTGGAASLAAGNFAALYLLPRDLLDTPL